MKLEQNIFYAKTNDKIHNKGTYIQQYFGCIIMFVIHHNPTSPCIEAKIIRIYYSL